ncbi:MAG: protoporphyrinogen/coproporphyrinogen oxidase [Candidatus Geothermincolia bacterium]
MEKTEVIVVGGGISGIAFAWKAARAGRAVLLLESGSRFGGCLHSHRTADDYWHELGAHTTYNSYGGFLDIAAGSGVAAKIVQRGPARAQFGYLRDDVYEWLSPPALLRRFNWLEIALSAPFAILRGKKGRTMGEYYGGLLGRGNYERFLRPFLAAVPSQDADGFPAAGPGSLFKKRPRRKEFPRSYGFDGGLQTVCDAALRTPGLRVATGVEVVRIAPAGGGFVVTAADGRAFEAPLAAVALPVAAAATLLRRDFPELGRALGPVQTVTIDSLGVVLPRARCWMPEAAFVIPAKDIFCSAVTRDPFPDPERRAFTFHFKSGHSREQQLRRMGEVLRVPVAELGEPETRRTLLPAPALGHDKVVANIGRLLAGRRLALTGNYFQGLAIEDCVQRSFQEFARVDS